VNGEAVRVVEGKLMHRNWAIEIGARNTAEHIVEGLAEANLLKTEAEARLIDAALGWYFINTDGSTSKLFKEIASAAIAVRAERDALAAQREQARPKPRWIAVLPYASGRWSVGHEANPTEVWTGFTQQQAEVVAQALNSLAEREGR
jgi:hypothetical protein